MEHQLFGDEQKYGFYDRFSHELRTTLTGIVGFSEYIEHTAEEPMVKYAAEVIHQGGQDVSRMMGAYLDYFRIESGHFNLRLSTFSLAEMIQESVSGARKSGQQRSAKVVFGCDDEFWGNRICSDLLFFRQVLDLLIQDFISTSNKNELIQINLLRGISQDSFMLSFVKTSDHEAVRAMQLFKDFWSDKKDFAFAKQEGPGACGAIAKRFVRELFGRVGGVSATNKTFQLDLIFPIQAEIN